MASPVHYLQVPVNLLYLIEMLADKRVRGDSGINPIDYLLWLVWPGVCRCS
jgi:hypothetical protein